MFSGLDKVTSASLKVAKSGQNMSVMEMALCRPLVAAKHYFQDSIQNHPTTDRGRFNKIKLPQTLSDDFQGVFGNLLRTLSKTCV